MPVNSVKELAAALPPRATKVPFGGLDVLLSKNRVGANTNSRPAAMANDGVKRETVKIFVMDKEFQL